jgi:heme A synthase
MNLRINTWLIMVLTVILLIAMVSWITYPGVVPMVKALFHFFSVMISGVLIVLLVHQRPEEDKLKQILYRWI